MNSAPRRALVVGGSMSGLFAALLLRQHGWHVEIYERSDVEQTGRGAGIVAQPELREALLTVGVDPNHDLGVEVAWRRTVDQHGQVVGELYCPQTETSWNKIFQMLLHIFPADCYHLNKDLVQIGQHGNTIVAQFQDRTSAQGDLLVGADGFRSTVRAQYLPEVQPIYAGYVAWRGLVNENALSKATHDELFEYFTFCLPPGEQMLGYPVAGSGNDLRAGHRRYNFVWYRPADEQTQLEWLLTDHTGKKHAMSIAPPLISPEVIREMREHSNRVLSPQFRDVVRLTDRPFLQPIYDLESPNMAFGRIALVGDAAFVARPHVGAGVAKAAQDAIALVAALERDHDVPAALARFESQRIGVGRRIVARARQLGACMRTTFRTPEERLLAERQRTPQVVMAETARMSFL